MEILRCEKLVDKEFGWSISPPPPCKKFKEDEMEANESVEKASGRWHGMEKNCGFGSMNNAEDNLGPNNRGMNGS